MMSLTVLIYNSKSRPVYTGGSRLMCNPLLHVKQYLQKRTGGGLSIVARKHAPGTAALQEIENAIQNDSPAMFAGATGSGFGWQGWSNFQLLGIIQVGRVGWLDFVIPQVRPTFLIFASFQTLQNITNTA